MKAEDIRGVLATVAEPYLGGDLLSAGVVGDIDCSGDAAEIKLCFPYPARGIFARVAAEAEKKLKEAGTSARFSFDIAIHAHTVQGGVRRLPGVKNIIAVASAKGGVGKSTTAANIALALAAEGAAVGVLDADVYGPSLPVMLGVSAPPASENNRFLPVEAHGLRVMSAGFLVGDDQPMAWRGPIATRAVTQLLRETEWGDVDYLVLDMPPGTGDIQLTIAQQVPVTGALLVTTPQEIAAADARRGLVLFGKVSIPVLGVVENMSVYCCPHCGRESRIFGEGGAQGISKRYGVDLLGELPLNADIRSAADGGAPSVVSAPDGDIAARYRHIARRAAAKIAQKSRDRTAAFPKIVISD